MTGRCVLAAVAAAFTAAAAADTVTLKGGSVLVGDAGAISGDVLKFKSDDLGEIDIKIAKIKSVDKAKSHVVQYLDGTTAERAIDVRDGELWANGAKLDMKGVKAVDPVPEKWHGSVNVAYNATRGNTYDNTATVLANVNRRWEKDRLTGDFTYSYADSGKSSSSKTKTADRWLVDVKHDHFWWNKVYHYENGRYERDVIQDLDSRFRLGLGAGYQWLDNAVFESTGKWNLNQEFGVNWVREEYGDGDSKKGGFAALRYAHHFGYVPKWYKNVEFFHNLEVLPEADEWEKFLANADVGLSTKLIMDFDLIAKIEWEHNSKPSGDRKKNDLRYIVGLGYKW